MHAACASEEFTEKFFGKVAGECFGISNACDLRAEYYVQLTDRTIVVNDDVTGIEVRLTGVSRGNREPKVFHDALQKLEELVVSMLQESLRGWASRLRCSL